MLSREKETLSPTNVVAKINSLWDQTPEQIKTVDGYCFFVNQKTKGIIAEGFGFDVENIHDRPLIVDSRIPEDTIMYTHKAYMEGNESIY